MTCVSSLTCNSHVNTLPILISNPIVQLPHFYRHADCLKNIYLKAANDQYAFKQYTPMLLQLYMLLISNVLLLNAVLSLDNGLPKDLQGGVLNAIIF